MHEYLATIVDTHDGDTITCNVDLGFKIGVMEMKFRLMGIDTAELSTDKGKAIAEYVKNLLPVGLQVVIKTIKLEKSNKEKIEKYGRYLCYVFKIGEIESINARLIREGLAVAYFGGKKETMNL